MTVLLLIRIGVLEGHSRGHSQDTHIYVSTHKNQVRIKAQPHTVAWTRSERGGGEGTSRHACCVPGWKHSAQAQLHAAAPSPLPVPGVT